MAKPVMTSAETETYTRREQWAVLISALGGYLLDFYNILIISFLMTAIQDSLNISLTEVGVIISVTLASSVIGGVLFGALADHYGRKSALMWSFALFSLAAIASGFSWSYGSLLFFRAIAGIGIGGEWGVGMALYNEVWRPKRRGVGGALIQSMSLLGIIAAVMAARWALATFGTDWGWRVALIIGAAPLLFLFLVRAYMPESKLWLEYDQMRKRGTLPPEKAKQKASVIEVLKGKSGVYFIGGLVMLCGYMYAFYGVSSFMPTYMAKNLHGAAGIVPATIIAALIAVPLFWGIGWLSDSKGRKTAMVLAAIVMLVGSAGIYFGSGVAYAGSAWSWPITWWYLVWLTGAGALCVVGPWLSELFPVETRSTATSSIYMFGRTMSAAAPSVVGIVTAASGSLLAGMISSSLALVVVVIAALLLPETQGRLFKVIESRDVSESGPDELVGRSRVNPSRPR